MKNENCEEPIQLGEAKPDYEELFRKTQYLSKKIIKLELEIDAFRYSLTNMYRELVNSQANEEYWKESYYRENSRANKLCDEVNKKLTKLYSEQEEHI